MDATNRLEATQRKVAPVFQFGQHSGVGSFDMLRRFGGHIRPVLSVAAFVLPIGLIIRALTFWGHGIIDSEAMEFVLNYLQKRPFFAQIFDPQINDWGAYQARELSYVFDLIDNLAS